MAGGGTAPSVAPSSRSCSRLSQIFASARFTLRSSVCSLAPLAVARSRATCSIALAANERFLSGQHADGIGCGLSQSFFQSGNTVRIWKDALGHANSCLAKIATGDRLNEDDARSLDAIGVALQLAGTVLGSLRYVLDVSDDLLLR
jgi:hypothetical protein